MPWWLPIPPFFALVAALAYGLAPVIRSTQAIIPAQGGHPGSQSGFDYAKHSLRRLTEQVSEQPVAGHADRFSALRASRVRAERRSLVESPAMQKESVMKLVFLAAVALVAVFPGEVSAQALGPGVAGRTITIPQLDL